MPRLGDAPWGFEDGQIVGYTATAEQLHVLYEFWNERRGTFIFEGFEGLRDTGAVGATVGSAVEVRPSEFVASLAALMYEVVPDDLGWRHFRFCGVTDLAVLDIVAVSCRFELSTGVDA